jgi:hypothetical protein
MTNPTGNLRRDFFRTLALDSPELLGAILRFNAGTGQTGTDQQGRTLTDNIRSAEKWQGLVNGSNRARAKLYGPLDNGFWDFEEESRRLALLKPSTFEKLILHWGAAFCAPRLNQVVLRPRIEVLGKKLGPGLLDFARGRGRFCLGDLSMQPKDPGTDDLAVIVPWCGLHAFRVCSAPWPESLKKIQDLGLKDFLARFPGPEPLPEPLAPAHRRAVWFSMKKVLLKEVAPEWTPCFS